jgi:hypothetical protein
MTLLQLSSRLPPSIVTAGGDVVQVRSAVTARLRGSAADATPRGGAANKVVRHVPIPAALACMWDIGMQTGQGQEQQARAESLSSTLNRNFFSLAPTVFPETTVVTTMINQANVTAAAAAVEMWRTDHLLQGAPSKRWRSTTTWPPYRSSGTTTQTSTS